MATSIVLDVTSNILNDGKAVLDIGLYDYMVVQAINVTAGSINTLSTNDGGAIEGVRDGSSTNATNFIALQLEDLSAGTFATSISADGNYRVLNPIGQYLVLEDNSVALDKVLVFLSKIY